MIVVMMNDSYEGNVVSVEDDSYDDDGSDDDCWNDYEVCQNDDDVDDYSNDDDDG